MKNKIHHVIKCTHNYKGIKNLLEPIARCKYINEAIELIEQNYGSEYIKSMDNKHLILTYENYTFYINLIHNK